MALSFFHGEMRRFAPEYVGEPSKCVYRIYRDTRFSKDKTPYKTHISALLLRNNFDKYTGSAAYYFAVSPENIEIAGGIYTPDRDVLLTVREHLAAHQMGEILRPVAERRQRSARRQPDAHRRDRRQIAPLDDGVDEMRRADHHTVDHAARYFTNVTPRLMLKARVEYNVPPVFRSGRSHSIDITIGQRQGCMSCVHATAGTRPCALSGMRQRASAGRSVVDEFGHPCGAGASERQGTGGGLASSPSLAGRSRCQGGAQDARRLTADP